MYILAESDYKETNWYKRILAPMKAEARRKRIRLCEGTASDGLPAGEVCAFLIGGSERWILDTARALRARGCHPILLNEIDGARLSGRYSRVRSDYGSLVASLAARGGKCALYGVNPASVSDVARREAFLGVAPRGEVFENRGSLARCFEDFWARHLLSRFDNVICANDFAAVSLYQRLRERGAEESVTLTVQASGEILGYFPAIQTVTVDPTALSAAAFEIADCIRAHPDFIGVSIAVEFSEHPQNPDPTVQSPLDASDALTSDSFYGDPEMAELLRIEQLLSSLDETDRKILHLLSDGCRAIGEEAFLSDNGVKYRIKKMKQCLGVDSGREIPAVLEKYGIRV